MSFEAQRTLLNETENALLDRKRSTTDPAEKAVLSEQIDEIRDLRDFATFDNLMETTATLNDLASVIEEAAGALKRQPFDGILGAYQSLLNKIGETTGKIIALEKPKSASEPPAASGQAQPEAEETPAAAAAPVPVSADEAAKSLAKMFKECEVRAENLAEIDHFYVKPMVKNRTTYQQVAAKLNIPWWFIGLIHGLEGAFSLSTHLHNGDALGQRTVNEPKNRPAMGAPPFTWIESAEDALRLKNFDDQADWSIGTLLNRLEEYNGLGYRMRGLPSPYLWSFSQHYEKGKFVEDHVFDPEKVSKQCGAATLLRRLQDKGLIDVDKPFDAEFGGAATANVLVLPRGVNLPDSDDLDLPDFAKKWAKRELDFPRRFG